MATDPNPTLKFSRSGQQLGDYKLLQVKEAMNLGRLLPTDHYLVEHGVRPLPGRVRSLKSL